MARGWNRQYRPKGTHDSGTQWLDYMSRTCCVCGERIVKTRQGGMWSRHGGPGGRPFGRHLTCRRDDA